MTETIANNGTHVLNENLVCEVKMLYNGNTGGWSVDLVDSSPDTVEYHMEFRNFPTPQEILTEMMAQGFVKYC